MARERLSNIGKVSQFPLPMLNAYFIGSLECFGNLLLIVGLSWRPLSLLLSVSMIVAYIAADFDWLSHLLSDFGQVF
jgi:putative oxidoreductase